MSELNIALAKFKNGISSGFCLIDRDTGLMLPNQMKTVFESTPKGEAIVSVQFKVDFDGKGERTGIPLILDSKEANQ